MQNRRKETGVSYRTTILLTSLLKMGANTVGVDLSFACFSCCVCGQHNLPKVLLPKVCNVFTYRQFGTPLQNVATWLQYIILLIFNIK